MKTEPINKALEDTRSREAVGGLAMAGSDLQALSFLAGGPGKEGKWFALKEDQGGGPQLALSISSLKPGAGRDFSEQPICDYGMFDFERFSDHFPLLNRGNFSEKRKGMR